MSAITDTTNATAAASGSFAQAMGAGTMGKEDFLLLLVTQLQNQDPMNPEDPTEFTAQLAQFSSLEQLFEVNNNLGEVVTSSGEMERLSALSMIGKEVVADNGQFRFSGEPMKLGYRLESEASDVSLHVIDGNGVNKASIPVQETAAGEHFIDWDGSGLDGNPLPEGDYQLVVKALNAQDEILPTEALVKSTIRGVDMRGDGHWLVSDAGEFLLGHIASVRDL
ncbi:MAG: flagellar hook assembly protein FlgD [Thermodesulfobacteriota bacterium]|jgi:flagellar basal-body rod modification protein FlgD|nr:flagellar hook assembly protein FlgD [Thermodesulfobacteriota bacterium]